MKFTVVMCKIYQTEITLAPLTHCQDGFLHQIFIHGNSLQMATKILAQNGSDNGFLPDGIKPLPEPMLTEIIGINLGAIL